jgi:antitoxin component YwqK of YwqJK toxin-antitoxin module
MHRLSALSAIVLVLVAGATQVVYATDASDSDPSEKVVKELMESVATAFNESNYTGFMSHFSPKRAASIRKKMKEVFAGSGNRMDIKDVRLVADHEDRIAFECNYEVRIQNAEAQLLRSEVVAVKMQSGWKVDSETVKGIETTSAVSHDPAVAENGGTTADDDPGVRQGSQVGTGDDRRRQSKQQVGKAEATGVPAVPDIGAMLGDAMNRTQSGTGLPRPQKNSLEGGGRTAPDISATQGSIPRDTPTSQPSEPQQASRKAGQATAAAISPSAEAASASTQKTFYPNGQLNEEKPMVNGRVEGIARAWYSNGCLEHETEYVRGVATRGTYWARSGKVIYEYRMDRNWVPDLSLTDFSQGPDGQTISPYNNERKVIPEPDPNDSFGATVEQPIEPPQGWPVVAMKAKVYTDEDGGDLFHGFVEWKTRNSVKASEFKIGDATSMIYDGSGSLAVVAGRRHGPFRLFYPSGKKLFSATFVNSSLHGTATIWYENGQTKEETPFLAGIWDGPYRAWHDNGQQARDVSFVADKREGVRRSWSKNGTLIEEGLYRNDLKEGQHKTWWSNGTLASEQAYAGGKLHGVSRGWNERGALIYDVAYTDGNAEGSKAFQNVVAKLQKAGFSVHSANNIHTARGHRVFGSAVAIKSAGETDSVVCVAEFLPQSDDKHGESIPVRDAIVARGILSEHVNYMHAAIVNLPKAVRDNLMYNDPVGRQDPNTTSNGKTEFVGFMLFGNRQCEVVWSPESRWFPSLRIWNAKRGNTLLMQGTNDMEDHRPSTTQLIKDLLSGGLSDEGR